MRHRVKLGQCCLKDRITDDMRSGDGAEGVGEVVMMTVSRLDRAAGGGPVDVIRSRVAEVEINRS